MLKISKAFSSFSVSSLEKAREFYSNTLGIEVKDNKMGILELHVNGNSPVMVYPKPDHRAAAFTVLNFPVPDIEKTVFGMKAKGVVFEHYEFENYKTDADSIMRDGNHKIAWFKDPDGNILSVVTE